MKCHSCDRRLHHGNTSAQWADTCTTCATQLLRLVGPPRYTNYPVIDIAGLPDTDPDAPFVTLTEKSFVAPTKK